MSNKLNPFTPISKMRLARTTWKLSWPHKCAAKRLTKRLRGSKTTASLQFSACCPSTEFKCESTDRDSVERQYINAADHFKTGRPINKVNYLRTLRRDLGLLRTGVKLKVSQTAEPIVRALQDRHGDFLLGLQGYAQKPEDPDNCTLFMDNLFAQIEVLCKKIENEDDKGESLWGRHTEANEDRFQTNPNKKPWHDRKPEDNKPTQWQNRDKSGKGGKGGKGGKSGKGGKGGRSGNRRTQRCKKIGCSKNTPSDKNFCTTCWRQGMEDGQIEMFTSEIYYMKDVVARADKNKAHRANKADKEKDAAKELKKQKDKNKKLEARLAQASMPDLYDKRGTEDEIDAEQVELFKPRKQRFGPNAKQQAGNAYMRTLKSGMRVGETWSEKELKITYIKKPNSNSGNKRPQEQPIAEGDAEDDWHYAEEEDHPGVDTQAADVGSGQMDEDQDVYAHSA